MAHDDRLVIALLQHDLRDQAQGFGCRVHRLVGVEIHRQFHRGGHFEEPRQDLLQPVHRVGDKAQNPVHLLHRLGDLGEFAGVGKPVAAHQADGLKVHLAGPFFALFRQHRPGPQVLPVHAVQMRAHSRRAMGIGAFQAKLHPRADILRGPVGVIVAHRGQRAHERAVGVGRARPDMALVQVGVHVGETGQHHRAGHLHVLAARFGDPAVLDPDIGADEVILGTCDAAGHGDVTQGEAPLG